jgi:hypothetical protein
MRPLCLADLEFPRVAVVAKSECGVAYERWMRVGMPRIPASVINDVFYLYASVEDAKSGRSPGGTGFIAEYTGPPGQFSGQSKYYYGVTNWHVACADGFSVVRLNTKDGTTDIVEFGPDEWQFLPGRYDVAAIPLSLDPDLHEISTIGTHFFLEKPNEKFDPTVGVGDDVFMIGLFVDHGGVATNVPSARFGNVSMLPSKNALIKQPNEYWGESYVIDMHSRTGFSGSPVFVFRTFGSDLTEGAFGIRFDELRLDFANTGFVPEYYSLPMPASGCIRASTLFRFLGIHWGQFPEKWELKEKSKLKESHRKDLIVDGGYVEGMSGMTCVIPAWQIMEVLDMPSLKGLRDAALTAAKQQNMNQPKAESARPTSDENPNAREDFMRLANAAARKRPRDD